MLVIEPLAVVQREAEPCVAVATKVTMEGFGVVEALTDEVSTWLAQHDAVPSGSPFVRIVTSDMSAELDIEVGLPVHDPPDGDDRFTIGSIPGGSYVRLLYGSADDHDHYLANVDLQAWAKENALAWAIDSSSGVDVWL